MTEIATGTPAATATSSPTPDGGSSSQLTVKPGMSTSEFVVTMIIVFGGYILASGIITNNTYVQIAGALMATLKAMLYTWSRTMVKTAAMLLIVSLGLHTQAGCATGGSTADKTLRATLTTTDAARAAFGTLDLAYQERLRTSSTTQEEARTKIENYRSGEQTKIVGYFTDVYAAIAAFAIFRDDPHFKTLETVALQLATELKLIQLPGGK